MQTSKKQNFQLFFVSQIFKCKFLCILIKCHPIIFFIFFGIFHLFSYEI